MADINRWMVSVVALLAGGLAACGDGAEPWMVSVDAGSDSTRAEITLIVGDTEKVFETALPWNDRIELPDGGFTLVLRVRSLDGEKVGCGIGNLGRGDRDTFASNRTSQGGGLHVECTLVGAIDGDEVEWESSTDVLTPLDGSTDESTDDSTDDSTAAETTEPATTEPATTEPPATDPPDTTSPDTSAAAVSGLQYADGVVSVRLDDFHGGPDVVLAVTLGTGATFNTPTGLPDYLIVSGSLDDVALSLDMSPTFGDSLEEILPDAPDGLVRDDRLLSGDLSGAVQQLAGASGEATLHGAAVRGDWKVRCTVFLNRALLASGELTIDQVAAALQRALLSFTVSDA